MIIKKDNRLKMGLIMAKQAFGDYKPQIAILIVLSFVGGILEGVGINAVIPLFSFVTADNGGQPTDFISQMIKSFFGFLHLTYNLKYLLIFIALLFFLKAAMWFLARYITDRIKANYARDAREKLFNLTLRANWQYLSKQKIGYLEKVLINDINAGASLLSYLSALVILIFNMLVYIAVAVNISLIITLLTLIIGAIVFLVFKPLAYKTKKISYQSSMVLKEVAHHINESTLGAKTIKAMSLEAETAKIGSKYFQKLRDIEIKLSILSNGTYAAVQPLSVCFILAIFAFSYKNSIFSLASFAVIVYAINKIFLYIQSGQSNIQSIAALYPFLKVSLDYRQAAEENMERFDAIKKILVSGEIELKNVYFNYQEDRGILKNINIKIKSGSMVGIMGPSGSGKTTLVDILLGLIKPNRGVVTVGGVNLEEIGINNWRKGISYVAQDMFLANDTIANNIKFYDQNITDKQVADAAKMANIFDFIEGLKDKMDTMVGERGLELSGGQRQRIVLARALARRPKVLILDEATNALDKDSERSIWNTIQSLRGRVTIIVVAHQPSSVEGVDELLVIQDGEIIESGQPQKLLAKANSYFARIYREEDDKK